MPHSDEPFINTYDGALSKGFGMLINDHIQAYIDAIRVHVPKAEYYYTGCFATTECKQFRKIKIMSQQNAAFIQSFA